jgi:hypothetical protein
MANSPSDDEDDIFEAESSEAEGDDLDDDLIDAVEAAASEHASSEAEEVGPSLDLMPNKSLKNREQLGRRIRGGRGTI